MFFVAIAFLGVAMVSNAQEIKFGVKAGANFSNIKVDSNEGGLSPDGATSLYVGALVDFALTEKFHIQPEIQYSLEGIKDGSLTYLNIPLMGKLYLVEGFNVQAGPQIGFLVDAEGGTDGLKSTNFGLNAGAAYELPMGIFFDARYTFGLSSINDEDAGLDGLEIKTRNFQLGVGYRF